MKSEFLFATFPLLLALGYVPAGQANRDTKPAALAQKASPQKSSPADKESFWARVLRISGVSATPNTLKGGNEDVESGQLWIADLRSGARKRVSENGDYRSPVFCPNSRDVLALQGTDVVRLRVSGGEAEKLYSIAGISKLVGFSMENPDQVLVLRDEGGRFPSVVILSLTTGNVIALPFDAASDRDRQMLEHLEDWQRTYGNTTVYVKRESKQEMSGEVERSNVFIKMPGQEPQSISRCNSTNCGQPSLSSDGTQVAFIMAEP